MLELACTEAEAHPAGAEVLTLHMLLAILHERDGSGVRILRALGVDPGKVRSRTIAQLRENAA